MVDARQQPALAPFLGGGFRRKAPAHRKTLCLKRGERDFDFGRGQTERTRERVGADRPQPFQPAAYDLDKGFVARPRPSVIRWWDSERRRRFQLWPMRETAAVAPPRSTVSIFRHRSVRHAFDRKDRQASRSSAGRTQLRRRSKSRATPRHRAIRRHFPPRAMLQTAPARWPQDRDGQDRRRPAAKSSDASSPPGSCAPPAVRRRDRRMAAPTTLQARAATAPSGRAQ